MINAGCCFFDVVDAVAGKLSGRELEKKRSFFTCADSPCGSKIFQGFDSF